mmetsp:Transcript_20461/g.46441  ORF Transcript_20461/g.46441 Transcript_20461/m.46441 type:complete len:256 (-) Transcript_20461:33-800(-)
MPSIVFLTLLQTLVIIFSPLISLAYNVPPPPPAIVRHVRPPSSTNISRVAPATIFFSALPSTTLSEAAARVPPAAGSMQFSVPLSNVRGRWRILEVRGPAMSVDGTPRTCASAVTFRGFIEDLNRGVVDYESAECGEASGGRWVTRPSAKVKQLSACWKLRLPAGRFIYRGTIEAGTAVGRNGSVSAEMAGEIITGDEVGKEKRVGTFRADLVRSFDSADVMIGEGSGPVLMVPKDPEPPTGGSVDDSVVPRTVP